MNNNFKVTARNWNHWGRQSVKFIKQYVQDKQEEHDLDEPFLRSCYILLSYAFELMVKSRLVMVSSISEAQLKKEFSHNIIKILGELKKLGELENIGIKNFRENSIDHTFIIENTGGKETSIDDFTNIRYSPKFGDYSKAHQVILDTTEVMLKISEKILDLNQKN